MSPKVSDQDLGNALLESVRRGSFPQSEHVASAPVSSEAIPKLLEVIGTARENTKDEIRSLARSSASDVDGWIAEARKLQVDIERSKATTQEIVKQAEFGNHYTRSVQDAASKVSFLYSELAFNEDLVSVVEHLQDISTLLESAQDAAVHGHVNHALNRLEDTHGALRQLGPFENTRIVGVLKSKLDQIRATIGENIFEAWNELITVDATEHRITIKKEVQKDTPVTMDTVVEALNKLELFESFSLRVLKDLDNAILSPRLILRSGYVSEIKIDGDSIQSSGKIRDPGIRATLEDIECISEFLRDQLPSSIAVPLSQKLVSIVASRLISNWLLPSIPLSTDGVLNFQETLSLVLGLAEFFDELEWSGQERLREWVDKSAEIWLSKRKEQAIAQVRTLCFKFSGDKRTVERVETQIVSNDDAMLGESKEEQDDDWGAEWGDEEEEHVEENKTEEKKPEASANDIEEEDMSAWGEEFGEENEEEKEETKPEANEETGDDDAEAWGWGDEDETQRNEPQNSESSAKKGEKLKPNGTESIQQKQPSSRELTLKETYTVTAIPDSIIEIIMQAISDVGTLNQPELVKSAIAPASSGLYAIPSLLLAMYRATAATYYTKEIAGNFLVYNDSTRLADRLRSYSVEQLEKDKTSSLPAHLKPSNRLKLDKDIQVLEGFGKRAYGREMESQRQIIRDHLDSAQGFGSCTAHPFADECDNAISMTIDRIYTVKSQWQAVLSHSALLQSLGSLVSTTLTKFINDVEDMSDIAADESKKLRQYCEELSKLSDLFKTEEPSGETKDMSTVYLPNWFKFQYLSEILDGSLADIVYFWKEEGLKLEMQPEEVIDLINALFADSEYRRKAIGDIRRTSM